uniref:Uncharacterized protein n=1 Tax=Anguilla anguilla TaxID=7936 RepID=A0A0E9Y0M7_ANGAN
MGAACRVIYIPAYSFGSFISICCTYTLALFHTNYSVLIIIT